MSAAVALCGALWTVICFSLASGQPIFRACEDVGVEKGNHSFGCEVYNEEPFKCGLYDDDGFNSHVMCCACGGGVRASAVSGRPASNLSQGGSSALRSTAVDAAQELKLATSARAGRSASRAEADSPDKAVCHDTDSLRTDSRRLGCRLYRERPHRCGKYDDDDFVSETMCCSCGGGARVDEKLLIGGAVGGTLGAAALVGGLLGGLLPHANFQSMGLPAVRPTSTPNSTSISMQRHQRATAVVQAQSKHPPIHDSTQSRQGVPANRPSLAESQKEEDSTGSGSAFGGLGIAIVVIGCIGSAIVLTHWKDASLKSETDDSDDVVGPGSSHILDCESADIDSDDFSERTLTLHSKRAPANSRVAPASSAAQLSVTSSPSGFRRSGCRNLQMNTAGRVEGAVPHWNVLSHFRGGASPGLPVGLTTGSEVIDPRVHIETKPKDYRQGSLVDKKEIVEIEERGGGYSKLSEASPYASRPLPADAIRSSPPPSRNAGSPILDHSECESVARLHSAPEPTEYAYELSRFSNASRFQSSPVG